MEDLSHPKHNRKATEIPGLLIQGNKNIIAHNVIYQFGAGGGMARAAKAFDGVDWRRAPKTAQWWAMDANGNAHWFCSPNVAAFTDFWLSEPLSAPDFGFRGEWRESLTERPRDQ